MKSDVLRTYNYHRYFVGSLAFVAFFIAGIVLTERGECGESVSEVNERSFHMSINRPEGTPLYTWVNLIYKEVFRRLNMELIVEYYPLGRASIQTNEGRADGEPARIHAYGTLYPNLIRIDESVFPMTVGAYTTDPSIPELNGWESLKNTEYVVQYPRGMKICENNLSKVVKAGRLTDITETSQGLQMLALKRTDLYVDDVNSVIPFLKNGTYNLQGKVHLAGIMQEVPLYMYVHKRHTSLVPQLADAIKEIKAEGLIEHYHKIAFDISDD
ncbi:hypothetical protein [Desulfosediminicola flagellatus]|uniref:hypothetical protein n=1 Tax=Desulfosediminicola flagellatus TaxID=2569541 RepID=UPI0010AC6CCF|nr:hypothetical protein [Desulfosediminicola flagellatus]